MTSIAFLGLGHMGLPMARNLQAAGHEIRAFDVVPAANDAGRAAGIAITESAAAALDGAAVVITMFPMGEHVIAAYEGDEGLLALAAPDTLFIDCSTIAVTDAQRAHALAAHRRPQSSSSR